MLDIAKSESCSNYFQGAHPQLPDGPDPMLPEASFPAHSLQGRPFWLRLHTLYQMPSAKSTTGSQRGLDAQRSYLAWPEALCMFVTNRLELAVQRRASDGQRMQRETLADRDVHVGRMLQRESPRSTMYLEAWLGDRASQPVILMMLRF